MIKKVPKKILRIERNFFVNLRKKCFWPPTPCRRRFFGTGGAPPPPGRLEPRAARPRGRTAAAARNWPARRRRRHNDVGAQLYLKVMLAAPIILYRPYLTIGLSWQ